MFWLLSIYFAWISSPFWRARGGGGLLLWVEVDCYPPRGLLPTLCCESFREYFTYEVVYRQKCSLLLTFTRLKSLASLVILTSGEFSVFAIYSYPPLHLRPSNMPFFCCWRWGNQWFQKLIMRFQPFKLKNGFSSGIILAATTSAIKTSKGSVCYSISH